MPRYASILIATVLTCAVASVTVAQQSTDTMGGMSAVSASSITFADIAVPGFDPGLQIAVIDGNPDEAGPYTLRLSFPAGYRFPPHFHPMTENLTVLSGTLLLAMGERMDESKLRAYGVGDYLHIPATKPHFGGARGATVIQLHGPGPFKIELVQTAASR
ncbi:MAG TPA: cupin domain-containing protein [Gemmatimonadales bacterium]|nr:cupin domain-containing protein [Gemmatimonadales bacterium]